MSLLKSVLPPLNIPIDKLLHQFSHLFILESQKKLPPLTVSGIEWNLEKAKETDLCFYELAKTEKSYELFRKRLKKSSCKVVLLPESSEFDEKVEGKFLCSVKGSFLEAQKELLEFFYPYPTRAPILFGVTGTDGKTTTSFLLYQALNLCGKKCFLINGEGERDHLGQSYVNESGLTTRPYIENYKRIAELMSLGAEMGVLELSSHALEQGRAYKMELEGGIWTSFGRDHLDYHENLENYFQAKASMVKMFSEKAPLILPREDESLWKRVTYSHKVMANDFSFNRSKLSPFFAFPHNQSNLSLVITLLEKLGLQCSEDDLKKLSGPKGRCEMYHWEGRQCLIDFAHTPLALRNLLKGIRDHLRPRRLGVVFGAGGDRDSGKRSEMGDAALEFSDWAIVTNDNPRTENPEKIVEDIVGTSREKFAIVLDRKKAILEGLQRLREGDLLVLAGKGDEDYQVIGEEKCPFSEKEIVNSFIKINKTES